MPSFRALRRLKRLPRAPIEQLSQLPLGAVRPNWLTGGALRLLLLCLFIVLVEMLRPRLSPHSAGIVVLVGALVVVAGALTFVGSARRLAARLRFLPASQRTAESIVLLIRRTGLPLLGLAFFLCWTFVYMALWWFNPPGAFGGLGRSPRFADFFYYAVSTSFIAPPVDIVAHTRGARAATMIEMLSGLALVTVYLSSFIDWQRGSGRKPEEEGAPGIRAQESQTDR